MGSKVAVTQIKPRSFEQKGIDASSRLSYLLRGHTCFYFMFYLTDHYSFDTTKTNVIISYRIEPLSFYRFPFCPPFLCSRSGLRRLVLIVFSLVFGTTRAYLCVSTLCTLWPLSSVGNCSTGSSATALTFPVHGVVICSCLLVFLVQ